MALSGCAQLMAHGGEETALGRVGLFGCGARQIERLFLDLAVGDVTHHGDNFGFKRSGHRGRLPERPAAHFDPDEIDRIVRKPLATAPADRAGHEIRRCVRRRRAPASDNAVR